MWVHFSQFYCGCLTSCLLGGGAWSQAAALALRKQIGERLSDGIVDQTVAAVQPSPHKHTEERLRAITTHAIACRDSVAWAQGAGCFAPYERGMARLLERYAAALRAAEHMLIEATGSTNFVEVRNAAGI